MSDPADTSQWINLANPRLGAQVESASDDFFAPKERLIQTEEPVFEPDKYDDHGKWMDGWESRRRRGGGHDSCVVRLGLPGIVHSVDIDTRHFTGNYPPQASLEARFGDGAEWTELLPPAALDGDAHNYFAIDDQRPWTHVRLNIYPDGGVARLRIYGEIYCDPARHGADEMIDLVALPNGGRALACNDEHFGAMQNLIMPGRGVNMGDGWETRRRRDPGNDWVILKLGVPGVVKRAEIDTAHFKGNFPERASIEATRYSGDDVDALLYQNWSTLLPAQTLKMDNQHYYETELNDIGPVTHVRVNIFPDGGLSRVRLFGFRS